MTESTFLATTFMVKCLGFFAVATLVWKLLKPVLVSIYLSVYAFLLNYIAKEYNRCMTKRKEKLFDKLHDMVKRKKQPLQILEVGVGAGANFKYFPEGVEVTCLEPNDHFKSYLTSNAQPHTHMKIKAFIQGCGECMSEIANDSVDAVVCTLVLCTVNDVPKTLSEIKRVLKPGGKLFYMEHVAAKTPFLLTIQYVLLLPWYLMLDGCVLNRDTGTLIKEAGFKCVKNQDFFAELDQKSFYIIRPHIMGVAEK